MINFKYEISKLINETLDEPIKELEQYIEIPKDKLNGDYAFACFRLAKTLKQSPNIIAKQIYDKINKTAEIIDDIQIIGGYLNFYINKKLLVKEVLTEIENKKIDYGKQNIGKNENIVIDYSSPNIAKPFHIGHLRSTVIGGALYRIYKFLGYNSIGINHLGDYGTQFGKLIEGYKRWGKEYDIENNPIDELTKIYIRINELCKEDEKVLEECRNNFKKLEENDEFCIKLWKKFKDLSLKEFEKVYKLLGSEFDSYNGEAFYADKMEEVIDLLEKSGKLIESQGAQIIDLEEKNMPPCIIKKTNDSTTYATRDLAAILYRIRTYNFKKALYVTSYEQILHFKQIFEVAKLLGIEERYVERLEHVPFGMVQLKSGKMSTREGNIIKLEELLNEAINKTLQIIKEKDTNLTIQEQKEIAKKVGIGAIIFNDLSNSRIKDEIFDCDTMLNFNGETGPYIQYTYVRTNSILNKVEDLPKIEEVDFNVLINNEEIEVIKLLYSYKMIVETAAQKNEPSIVSRFLIELSKKYSAFYNESKIMTENKNIQNARIYLTYATNLVLKSAANLLGIEMPTKM